MSAISDKYNQLGGANSVLGHPISREFKIPNGGLVQHYQHGTIYWHPDVGAFEVHGAIRAKYDRLGGVMDFLGYPTTDEEWNADETGKFNHFQGGAIVWKRGNQEAFETHGAILQKWGSFNFEFGFLGFPVTDETPTPDNRGRFNHYEHGSIYWKDTISAHEIHGGIRDFWAAHGFERNPDLGYPISDVLQTRPGSNRSYSDFENGVVLQQANGNVDTMGIGMRFDEDQVTRLIRQFIAPNLDRLKIDVDAGIVEASIEAQLTGGPSITELSDYSFDGRVHNRRYKVHMDITIAISSFLIPNGHCSLDIWIEIEYKRAERQVVAHILDSSITVNAIASEMIADAIKQEIEKLSATPQVLFPAPNDPPLPEEVNILSVKVLPNRSLAIYLEPPF